MSYIQGRFQSRFPSLKALAVLSVCLMFLCTPLVRSQQHNMESMPAMNMAAPAAPDDPTAVAKRLADKQESEFNHHLIGLFVIVAGFFILTGNTVGKGWPLARYAWPICFFAAGLFVLIFSDTEIWPFGPETPWYAITHNTEDLQHKIFAIMLLAIGGIEFQRARGRLKLPWTAWFFPVVGGVGSMLLLFHVHSGNMKAPHAMETMQHIQKQHHWFAAAGLGAAIANGLAEIQQKWQRLFGMAWPVSLIVLGVLLTQYTE
jgi:hypothetical protein